MKNSGRPAKNLDAPVSLHILTGHSYNKDKNRKGVERYRGSVNLKLMDIANALFELVFCGVLERHPEAQNRLGGKRSPAGCRGSSSSGTTTTIASRKRIRRPSRAIRAASSRIRSTPASSTIMSAARISPSGARTTSCGPMISRIPTRPGPTRIKIIERDLGHLPAEIQRKVVCDNVCRLYDIDASKLPRVQKQAA